MADTLLQTIQKGFAELKTAISAKPAIDHSPAIAAFQVQVDSFKADAEEQDAILQKTAADLQTATTRAEKAEKELGEAKAALAEAQSKQAEFDAKVETAAAAKAQSQSAFWTAARPHQDC